MATNDAPNPFDANGHALPSNTLLTITLLLFFLIVLIISLHFYARWYLRRARLRHRRSYLVFYVDSVTSDAATPAIGLHPSVIQSLPVFVYSAHSNPVECAVCLSDFEENESGRILPKCEHTFHLECIDMWFQSHSTCPLCRSVVEPVPHGHQSGPEVVIDVCETGSSAGCRQDEEEENRSGRTLCSLSSSAIGLGRKPSSAGVTIDVPLSRSFGREAEVSATSFRSPGGRLLSFKRILSGEWKPSPSSPSPENCAGGCHSVTEKDMSQRVDSDTQCDHGVIVVSALAGPDSETTYAK